MTVSPIDSYIAQLSPSAQKLVRTLRQGGYIRNITWHWSAGLWTQLFSHYHGCANFNEKKRLSQMIWTLTLMLIGSHVWHRNTGNVGLSMMAMGRESYIPLIRPKPRFHGVQNEQIQVLAKTSAELVLLFDLDPHTQVHDHVYWARMDGYGPGSGDPETRIDIGEFEPLVRKAMMWYIEALKAGTHKFEHTVNLK